MKLLVTVIAVLATAAADRYYFPPDPCNNKCDGENMECLNEEYVGKPRGRDVCRCNIGYEDVGDDAPVCKEAKVYSCRQNNCKDGCKDGYYRSDLWAVKTTKTTYYDSFCTKTTRNKGDCGDWGAGCWRFESACKWNSGNDEFTKGIRHLCKETCKKVSGDACQKQEATTQAPTTAEPTKGDCYMRSTQYVTNGGKGDKGRYVQPIETAAACQELCQKKWWSTKNFNCTTWSWTMSVSDIGDSGICFVYPEDAEPGRRSAPGYISGPKNCPGNCSPVKVGIYLSPYLISRIRIEGKMAKKMNTQGECISACQTTPHCRFWNYVTTAYSNALWHNTCSLFKKYRRSYKRNGYNSGSRNSCDLE